MIRKLVERAKSFDIPPGYCAEMQVHPANPFEDALNQHPEIMPIGDFVDRWWDQIEVLKDFETRHSFCCNCEDEWFAGIVHEDGVLLVRLGYTEVAT
jgi:hypothetical protein